MIELLAEAGHDGTFVEQTLELLRSGPHWVFEVVSDFVLLVILYKPAALFWNGWHAKHDAEHHGKENENE